MIERLEHLRVSAARCLLAVAGGCEAVADVLLPAPHPRRKPVVRVPVGSNGRPDPEHVSGRVAQSLERQRERGDR